MGHMETVSPLSGKMDYFRVHVHMKIYYGSKYTRKKHTSTANISRTYVHIYWFKCKKIRWF